MTASLVSIVVPAYNHSRFLRQAIESVLEQTHPAVELIVLDDGSSDDTASILESYGRRFYWESHSNMGQAATLNKGWAMAKGSLVGYLSADDYLHPNALARAVAALEASPEAVLVYPDFDQVDEQGRRLRTVVTQEYDYMDLLVRGMCPPGPGAVLRKAALQAAGGWDPAFRRVPDYECWLRLGLVGPFRRVPAVLGAYRVHGQAQSFSAVSEDRADEQYQAVAKLLARNGLPAPLRAVERPALANALLYAARLHLMSGRTGGALRRLVRALRTYWGAALWLRTYRLLLSGAIWRLRLARA